MPHVRSEESKLRRAQRKAAKDFVWKYSFNDYLKSESISLTDPEDVADYLYVMYGADFDNTAVPCTFKGVVISDAYGNGAFQK